MRYAPTIAVVSIVAASAYAWGPAARSADDPSKQQSVKVSLAVTEGYGTVKHPLYVIIENVTDKPQSHFEEWNSWGYGNLALEWTDSAGKSGTVAKVPGSWDRNVPSTVTLEPGESLVREISFDSNLWQGWPEIPNGSRLKLQVTYRSQGEPDVQGWVGQVISKEQTVLFK